MHLMPMLIQALNDNASPILQLPHINQTQLRHMATKQVCNNYNKFTLIFILFEICKS